MDAPREATAGPDSHVRRRHVFYVGGFDPSGPAHYHRLYAEEARKQAAVSGFEIAVGPRRRAGDHASQWSVDASWRPGDTVATTVEFLRWDDIVRANWPRSRWAVMLSTLGTTARQLANGVLWRVLKTSWPAFLVLFLPPALVVGLIAWLGLTVGMVLALAAQGVVAAAAGACIALASFLGWTRFARWAEAKVQMAWLMRSTRFILRQARGATPELEKRIDEFAARVHAALGDDAIDEVLVVGHSSGAMLAVSTAARALARRAGVAAGVPEATARHAPALSLLTLGECIPMLSYQPEARAFRAELASLATSQSLVWLDFTAPPDGCCFALVDPTAACAERLGAARWSPPKRLSPRFAQLFGAESYARIRADKYRCHFQYLMASELPGAYDYFAITAGPARLGDRFSAQAGVTQFRDFQLFGGDR
jgi:pimeloyl-ACP methyl ester carboxylesterase